ncbi:nucleoside-diphosphate kinase [Candidatus Dependentiae bacterium]|nr:nucleoside-diphosphate kinase [Candidatus Dependentiae bacterium]
MKKLLIGLIALVALALGAAYIKNRNLAISNALTNPESLKEQLTTQVERTFGIIKPDAVKAFHAGQIITAIELNKFSIVGMKKTVLTKEQAQKFYEEHKERPFYNDLVSYMTTGPVILLALEKHNAIQDWRDLIGTTDPAQARIGTLRFMFGTSKSSNGLHGSDSVESAQRELTFFFPELQ